MDFTGWDIRCLAREMSKLLPDHESYPFRWIHWLVPVQLCYIKTNQGAKQTTINMVYEWDNNPPFRKFMPAEFHEMMEEVKKRYPSTN